MRTLGEAIGLNFADAGTVYDWAGPVVSALDGNPVCDSNPSCVADPRPVAPGARRARRRHVRQARRSRSATAVDAGKPDPRVDGEQPEVRTRRRDQGAEVGRDGQSHRRAGPTGAAPAGRQPAGRCESADRRRRQVAGRLDQEDQLGTQRSVGIPVGDEGRRQQTTDGRLLHPAAVPHRRRVQKGRSGFHLAGRPFGALPGPERHQPVQHRRPWIWSRRSPTPPRRPSRTPRWRARRSRWPATRCCCGTSATTTTTTSG